jgi:hypothetical protein
MENMKDNIEKSAKLIGVALKTFSDAVLDAKNSFDRSMVQFAKSEEMRNINRVVKEINKKYGSN